MSKKIGRPQVLHAAKTGLARRLRAAIGTNDISEINEIFFPGMSRQTVKRYLVGETEPPGPVLAAISDKTGVPVEWLLTGKPNPLEVRYDRTFDHGENTSDAELAADSHPGDGVSFGATPAQVAVVRSIQHIVSRLLAAQQEALDHPEKCGEILELVSKFPMPEEQ